MRPVRVPSSRRFLTKLCEHDILCVWHACQVSSHIASGARGSLTLRGGGIQRGYSEECELTVNRCVLCPVGILGRGGALGRCGCALAVMAVPNIRGTVRVPIIIVIAVIVQIAHIMRGKVGGSGKGLERGGTGRGRWDEDILESQPTARREGHQTRVVILPFSGLVPLEDDTKSLVGVGGEIDVSEEVLSVEGVLDGEDGRLVVI